MAHKLTSKEVDPLTGMQNSYIGWHWIMTEALDVLAAMVWLKTQTGWDYSICANPDNPYLIRLSLTGPIGNVQVDPNNPAVGVMTQVIVDDTDYFIYEQGVFTRITEAESANYNIEPYTLPTPPSPPAQVPATVDFTTVDTSGAVVDPNPPLITPPPAQSETVVASTTP
jgi:hypothetical protein